MLLFVLALLAAIFSPILLRKGFETKRQGVQEEKLLQAGRDIFYGKGRCGLCHTIGVERGGKCPNLDGAGERMTREFIYEAMIDPSAYIRLDFDLAEPKRYPAQMPAVNRPPIGLTRSEMESVMAFVLGQRGVGATGIR